MAYFPGGGGRLGTVFFAIVPRTVVETTRSPNQRILEAVYPAVSRPERKADHLFLVLRSIMRGALLPLLHIPSRLGA
jgi:hypothetical protein